MSTCSSESLRSSNETHRGGFYKPFQNKKKSVFLPLFYNLQMASFVMDLLLCLYNVPQMMWLKVMDHISIIFIEQDVYLLFFFPPV